MEETIYKIKNFEQIRPSVVLPDVTKLGLRYSFFEGLGFIEYGQFSEQTAKESNYSQRDSIVRKVRSDKSFTNLLVE